MILQNYKTLIVLTLAQCFGQTAAPILILLGGIVGAQLAPSIDLATLPIAIQIIGLASATLPATFLMSKLGRKAGFLIGNLLCLSGALLAAWSIAQESFVLFCVAAFMVGNFMAFSHQVRFAVAESVPTEQVPKSLAILMFAGIVAAILGPEIARRFSDIGELPLYVGSFLGMAMLITFSFVIVLLFYQNSMAKQADHDQDARPMAQIFTQPAIILAIIAAAVGYCVMSLVMTATPVSMHEMEQYSLDDTTRVIQSHILAMFIPSLFSGFLITWFGALRIIQAGFISLVACVVIGWGKPEFIHYWGSLVLLGIGWNFLYLGGTTLLTRSYRSAERFKVQGVNDFLVFGLQAIGSLSAGILLAGFGWNGVMGFALPLLALLLTTMVLSNQQLKTAGN
ncbi:MAG: MFS transporter [Gammaproteobacteria bacterium]|nr:MFS transporter [Gammaproteobacteria bacterium]MDD9894721.1 MFS transporter [Gammaproteobacteria bacterium]MDD9957395.1 MFS transporter [Gammaproteobacteria bacterium]